MSKYILLFGKIENSVKKKNNNIKLLFYILYKIYNSVVCIIFFMAMQTYMVTKQETTYMRE